MTTLKFPLEYDDNGSLVVVEDDTDEFYAQLLSLCVMTEPNTHPFSPQFGVSDPTFRDINRGLFMIQAARFFPQIEITSADIQMNEATGNTNLRVSFRRT